MEKHPDDEDGIGDVINVMAACSAGSVDDS